jgi:hypothetical protein
LVGKKRKTKDEQVARMIMIIALEQSGLLDFISAIKR